MTQHTGEASPYEQDRERTLRNREVLLSNVNLRTWYLKLYEHQFESTGGIEDKKVLEIGSGASPLKSVYPHVLTSDILDMDHIDYVFDCHNIDCVSEIDNDSIDIITLTNVLHHLKDPVGFLIKASVKLAPGGILVATEPYFSFVSSPIYRFLHHEPVDLGITTPTLDDVSGPLSSANIALPFLIFFAREDWREPLWKYYRQDEADFRYFTSISYMLTGGMSYRVPLPRTLFNWVLRGDVSISQMAPRVTASFFTVTLRKR